ncbi:MAG: hypothetical protein KDD37_05260 [Bdellovibrionales bacterium]|nr:hypothetical protein [Bdellovibrionales bacterium]
MAIETIILFIITFFLLFGVFIGNGGIETSFQEAAPKLGAKIEKHLETGGGFTEVSLNAENPIGWNRKSGSGGTYRVEGLDNRNE